EGYMDKLEDAESFLDDPHDDYEDWPIEPRGTTEAFLDGREVDEATLREATYRDLADVLYGQVQNREDGQELRDRIDRFATALDRLDTEFYADLADHDYEVRTADGPEEMFGLAREFGTCVGFDVSYEAFREYSDEDWFAEGVDDPEASYLVVERDGEPVGFSRNLLLEDRETGEAFLGIDTLELPRDDYEAYRDAVKPLALASIEAGRELDVDFVGVPANEGSSKEVVDGYGGATREVAYRKPGEELGMVSRFRGAGERTLHVLWEDFDAF
ncbi:MAG: hypothetical protein SV186_03605, partial [Candidatus Nanohaloarchaea archaeon]|nr:hypothetical protein [Candidatus Nanohaloarchaea archaeon]